MTRDDLDSHGEEWLAPHGVMIELAWRMVRLDEVRLIAWIGRRTWPAPRAMIDAHGSRDLLARSIFVDTHSNNRTSERENRIWAAQQSLSCDGTMVVVWDASGFDMIASRRMQLAAMRTEDRPPVLALAVRPWRERTTLSAAATRWAVCAHSPHSQTTESIECEHLNSMHEHRPTWKAELLRGRGSIGNDAAENRKFFRATWSWSGG